VEEAEGDADCLFDLLGREAGGRALVGPAGDPDSIRAETLVSGPGRHRLFLARTRRDSAFETRLTPEERIAIHDAAQAGPLISRLSALRVPAALATDRLFGRFLAEAGQQVIRRAVADGARPDIPVFLGGKPSLALPYFGPSCRATLARRGFANALRPSAVGERGLNANLLGAAVLALRKAKEHG